MVIEPEAPFSPVNPTGAWLGGHHQHREQPQSTAAPRCPELTPNPNGQGERAWEPQRSLQQLPKKLSSAATPQEGCARGRNNRNFHIHKNRGEPHLFVPFATTAGAQLQQPGHLGRSLQQLLS